MNVRKLLVYSLLFSLPLTAFTSTANAAPAKKITAGQAKVIYEKAVKATNAWIDKYPFVITSSLTDGSKVIEKQIVTRDSYSQIKDEEFGNYNGVAIISGESLFASGSKFPLKSFELEIAANLGLITDAKFTRYNLPLPSFTNSVLNESTIMRIKPRTGDFGVYVMRHKPNCVLSVQSKEQLLSCRYYVDSIDDVKKNLNEVTYTISSGRFSKMVETFYDGTKITTTYKSFKGMIALPTGPFLEYKGVFNDPSFARAQSLYYAENELAKIVGHANALAAYDDRDYASFEDWKITAKQWRFKLYDRGMEYDTFIDTELLKVCAVFTAEGARLELVSCESLGFELIQL